MKKCATLALTGLLMLALLLPSFAAVTPTEVTTPGATASVEISTRADTASYTISFPADVKIPWEVNTQEIGNVVAKKLLLSPSSELVISVTSANDFKLIHEQDATKSIAYTLKVENEEKTSFRFGPGDLGKSVPLAVQIQNTEWNKAYAGKYADRLVFQIDYVNI